MKITQVWFKGSVVVPGVGVMGTIINGYGGTVEIRYTLAQHHGPGVTIQSDEDTLVFVPMSNIKFVREGK